MQPSGADGVVLLRWLSDLPIERHADEERERVLGEEFVGGGVIREMEAQGTV